MSPVLRARALVVAAVAAAVCVVGVIVRPEAFYHAYLIGFFLVSGLALGSLGLLCLQHVVTGQWGFVSQRVLEAGTRTVYWLPVLFVPVLIGLRTLYPWLGEAAAEPLIAHKAPYLNLPFFLGRAAFYFAVWIGLTYQLNTYSVDQDRGERSWGRRLQLTGAFGLLLYGLTVTFASVDWAMSLEPEWFSTIYGLIFMVGQVLSALALTVIALHALADRPPLSHMLRSSHFHDLGNLLLAFVLLWAYMAFSQYLIIWSGNLPEEITWYLRRSTGGWSLVAVILVVFHFAVPFVVLLARRSKQQPRVLSRVALGILVMRWVDLVWLVTPAARPGMTIHWLDVAAPALLVSIWIVLFQHQLGQRPLLPLHDARFTWTPPAASAPAPPGAMGHG